VLNHCQKKNRSIGDTKEVLEGRTYYRGHGTGEVGGSQVSAAKANKGTWSRNQVNPKGRGGDSRADP